MYPMAQAKARPTKFDPVPPIQCWISRHDFPYGQEFKLVYRPTTFNFSVLSFIASACIAVHAHVTAALIMSHPACGVSMLLYYPLS